MAGKVARKRGKVALVALAVVFPFVLVFRWIGRLIES